MKRRDPLKDWAHGDRPPKPTRLEPDDPDFDAEDLPHGWQRWTAEAAGAGVLVAVLIAAAILAYLISQ